jgi:hypothetical protein
VPGLENEKPQSTIARFNKYKSAAAGELVKLTRGTGGALREVQDWKNGLNSADSLAALRSGSAAIVDLLNGRIGSGLAHYNKIMKKDEQ